MTMPESERPLPPPPNLPTMPTQQSVSGSLPALQPPPNSAQSVSQALPLGARPQNGRRPQQPITIPSHRDEVAEDEYGVRTEADFAPEQAIDDQIADLEAWAIATEWMDRRELIRFWMLRGVGFLSAAAAVVGGALKLPDVAVVAGAVAA